MGRDYDMCLDQGMSSDVAVIWRLVIAPCVIREVIRKC